MTFVGLRYTSPGCRPRRNVAKGSSVATQSWQSPDSRVEVSRFWCRSPCHLDVKSMQTNGPVLLKAAPKASMLHTVEVHARCNRYARGIKIDGYVDCLDFGPPSFQDFGASVHLQQCRCRHTQINIEAKKASHFLNWSS